MRTLDKIDNYLKEMEDKENQRNSLEKIWEKHILEAKKDKDYDKFFNQMLKKYGVESFKDLPKDKQKKFFDEVDKAWKAKKETD
jgi:hypothetical protein